MSNIGSSIDETEVGLLTKPTSQELAVNPYSQFNSDNVNKLTRIISNGKNGIVFGLDVRNPNFDDEIISFNYLPISDSDSTFTVSGITQSDSRQFNLSSDTFSDCYDTDDLKKNITRRFDFEFDVIGNPKRITVNIDGDNNSIEYPTINNTNNSSVSCKLSVYHNFGCNDLEHPPKISITVDRSFNDPYLVYHNKNGSDNVQISDIRIVYCVVSKKEDDTFIEIVKSSDNGNYPSSYVHPTRKIYVTPGISIKDDVMLDFKNSSSEGNNTIELTVENSACWIHKEELVFPEDSKQKVCLFNNGYLLPELVPEEKNISELKTYLIDDFVIPSNISAPITRDIIDNDTSDLFIRVENNNINNYGNIRYIIYNNKIIKKFTLNTESEDGKTIVKVSKYSFGDTYNENEIKVYGFKSPCKVSGIKDQYNTGNVKWGYVAIYYKYFKDPEPNSAYIGFISKEKYESQPGDYVILAKVRFISNDMLDIISYEDRQDLSGLNKITADRVYYGCLLSPEQKAEWVRAADGNAPNTVYDALNMLRSAINKLGKNVLSDDSEGNAVVITDENLNLKTKKLHGTQIVVTDDTGMISTKDEDLEGDRILITKKVGQTVEVQERELGKNSLLFTDEDGLPTTEGSGIENIEAGDFLYGEETIINDETKVSITSKKIMNLDVLVYADENELNEIKEKAGKKFDSNNNLCGYYLLSEHSDEQLEPFNGSEESVLVSLDAENAPKIIGYGRYTYNPITCRLYYSDKKQNKVIEIQSANIHVGPDTPSNINALWLVPENDVPELRRTEVEDIRALVFKLGLKVDNLNRLIETGIVPGDTENSYKDELIDYSEFEMPTEFKETEDINSVKIYGPKNCFNNTKYYCIFNPVNTTSNSISWSFIQNYGTPEAEYTDKIDFVRELPVTKTIETLVDKTVTIDGHDRNLFTLNKYQDEFYISTLRTGTDYSVIDNASLLKSYDGRTTLNVDSNGIIYKSGMRSLRSSVISEQDGVLKTKDVSTDVYYDIKAIDTDNYIEYRTIEDDTLIYIFPKTNNSGQYVYMMNSPDIDDGVITSYSSTKTIFTTDAEKAKQSVFNNVTENKQFAFRYKISSVIPEEYVAGKQYFTGDFCTYQSEQYICKKYVRPQYKGMDPIEFSLEYWNKYDYSKIESVVSIGINDHYTSGNLETLEYNYDNIDIDNYLDQLDDSDKLLYIGVKHSDIFHDEDLENIKKIKISNVNNFNSLSRLATYICNSTGSCDIGDLFQIKKSNTEFSIVKVVENNSSSLWFRDPDNNVKYFDLVVQEDLRLQIKGPSDCGNGSCYYLDVNKKDLQSNPVWFFEDENSNKLQEITLVKIDNDEEIEIGTISIEHYDSIVCEICVEFLDNYDYADIHNKNLTLNCQYSSGTTLTATREINISGEKPRVTDMEPTVNAVCAKVDTRENIAIAKTNGKLYDGEILFYTDNSIGQIPCLCVHYQGKLYPCATKVNEKNGGALSEDDLKTIKLEYLNFKNDSSDTTNIIHVTDNGKIIATRFTDDIRQSFGKKESNGGDSYINSLLQINSFYLGDSNSNECMCSHNFVELANGSNQDINLDGLFLLYTDGKKLGTGYKWEVLKLKGVIPAESTFLIRGKKCNEFKRSFLKIDSYDLEWRKKTDTDVYNSYERNGDLIEFHQGSSAFYLCCDYESIREELESNRLESRWISTQTDPPYGYIDLVGIRLSIPTGMTINENDSRFGRTIPFEKEPISPNLLNFNPNNLLYTRRFPMDPAKQANKKYAKKNCNTLWSFIDLKKQSYHGNYSYQYYPDDELKLKYLPKCSMEHKSLYTNKTDFDVRKPNIINITFGIQATTDSINSVTATRCFNWVSVGYYDEYIEYKKTTDSTWKKVHSIDLNDKSRIIEEATSMGKTIDFSDDNTVKIYTDYYNKIRWFTPGNQCVTTHKCIIYGLTAGDYEYRIGRENNSLYSSEIKKFKVIDNPTEFTFIQTSDQQGFNWQEYQVWKKSCYIMNEVEKDSNDEHNFDFTINTGDIAQSGNRPNEWLDYYDGRQYIDDTVEMFTIGNNDLCAADSTLNGDGEEYSSKYNHINVLRYYTFEIDEENIDNDGNLNCYYNNYPIYSLYSYNYGTYHFICLNSEISKEIYYCYPGEKEGIADKINAQIEKWFLKDIEEKDGSKCIVYMHEMPFTMMPIETTYNELNNSKTNERGGSHLNTLNENGTYRFSRLFASNGIKLVIGGHKHTYTLMKPILDLPLFLGKITKESGEYKYFDVDSDGKFTLKSSLNSLERNEALIDLSTSAALKSRVSSFSDLKNLIDKSLDIENYVALCQDGTSYIKDAIKFSMKPVIITYNETSSTESAFCRYLNIGSYSSSEEKSYDAPTYVMCQATSYKLVSNKELPSPLNFTFNQTSYNTRIPWILSYFPCDFNTKAIGNKIKNDTHSTENAEQHNPMYIVYKVTTNRGTNKPDSIRIIAKQVRGILYGAQHQKVGKNYDENNQYDEIGVNSMTFGSPVSSKTINGEQKSYAKVYYNKTNFYNTDGIIDFEPVQTTYDEDGIYYNKDGWNSSKPYDGSYTIYT